MDGNDISFVRIYCTTYYYVFTMTYCERTIPYYQSPIGISYASAVATSSFASPSTFWGFQGLYNTLYIIIILILYCVLILCVNIYIIIYYDNIRITAHEHA